MGRMLTIAAKEVRTYFTTPIAYVVLAVATALNGFFFIQLLDRFQLLSVNASRARDAAMSARLNVNDELLQYFVINVGSTLLFVLPFLTMRLMAEEKRNRTYELLMTLPVTVWQLVLGKVLAALVPVFAIILLSLVFPVITALLIQEGSVEWLPVAFGYLAVLLMSTAYVAMGLFFSSMTRSQIIAGILGFCFAIMTWLIDIPSMRMKGALGEMVRYVSVMQRVDDWAKGVIALDDFVYFGSFIFFGLFLCVQAIESQRWRGAGA